MGIGSILIVVLLVGAGASGVYYAIEEEYLPVNLETRDPIESDDSSSSISYIQDLEDEYEHWANEIPNIENIEYEISVSSVSIEEIRNDYHDRLTTEGYSHDYSGSTSVKNVVVSYDGFVKGFTGIGIVMSPAGNFGGSDDETLVLYSTGNVADYYAIYNWFKNQ